MVALNLADHTPHVLTVESELPLEEKSLINALEINEKLVSRPTVFDDI